MTPNKWCLTDSKPCDMTVHVGNSEHTYRSGVGKMLHMMKWSRHDIMNRVRELSRFMSAPTDAHLVRMHKVMNYVKHTASLGNIVKPNAVWNGVDRTFAFVVSGRSDSEYAAGPDTRHSVSGGTVFLAGSVLCAFSRIQKCVTLSVTEAEFVAAVEVIQNMLISWRVLSSMGLMVTLPMIVVVDNKGAVDLANSWTATSRTRHIASHINFVRELKEEGVITVQWLSNQQMSSDIFTKNVGGSDFARHRDVYVRDTP
jgi:hypothetical protein